MTCIQMFEIELNKAMKDRAESKAGELSDLENRSIEKENSRGC